MSIITVDHLDGGNRYSEIGGMQQVKVLFAFAVKNLERANI